MASVGQALQAKVHHGGYARQQYYQRVHVALNGNALDQAHVFTHRNDL
jgi:hypothetical protein